MIQKNCIFSKKSSNNVKSLFVTKVNFATFLKTFFGKSIVLKNFEFMYYYILGIPNFKGMRKKNATP